MVSSPPKSRPSSAHGPSVRERSLIPVGMATILPQAAKRVRRLEHQLLAEIGRWGYDEIILPTFEYLDVLAPGLEAELLETCYQFIDRTTGRTLLLRPDATAQVARTIAMGLTGATLPQRLCYRTSVFRYEPEHAGRGREIFQVGAELVGVDDVAGDSEIVSLLIECLHRIGLPACTISLGHVGFIKGLLGRSGLSPLGQKRAEQAAAKKDLPRLEEVLAGERIAKYAARAIREASELTGGEDVLERGRVLAAGDPTLLEALERLAQLYHALGAAGHKDSLLLDLGEFRGFDYYDGVVFDVFAEGVGAELGGGGRYDHLIGRFGRELPSTGFALDVDRLFHAVKLPEDGPSTAHVEYLVVGPRRAMRAIEQVAGQLRRRDGRVVQQVLKGNDEAVVNQALSLGQARRVGGIVVVGLSAKDRDEVLVAEPVLVADPKSNGRVKRQPFKKTALADLLKGTARRRTAAS